MSDKTDIFDQVASYLRRVPRNVWLVLGGVVAYVVASCLVSLAWDSFLSETFGVHPLSVPGAMGLLFFLGVAFALVFALKEERE